MVFQLRLLGDFADTDPSALVGEADAAIAANGSWEQFFEVRIGAGPTVRIAPTDDAGYVVSVNWGSQNAELNVHKLKSAIECADRIAYVFYEMRKAKMIKDLPVLRCRVPKLCHGL